MKISTLTLFLFTVLISCKKKKSDITDNGYDPNKPSFRLGTSWTMRYTGYLSDGSTGNVDNLQFKIVREVIINGSKYFVTDDSTYFTNKSDGYYQYDQYQNHEVLWYKNPALNLETFQGYIPISPQQGNCFTGFNATVRNNDTTITVNGKLFDKLVYYTHNYYSTNCQILGSPYSKEIYSPKTGMRVLRVSYSGIPTQLSQKTELIGFIY